MLQGTAMDVIEAYKQIELVEDTIKFHYEETVMKFLSVIFGQR